MHSYAKHVSTFTTLLAHHDQHIRGLAAQLLGVVSAVLDTDTCTQLVQSLCVVAAAEGKGTAMMTTTTAGAAGGDGDGAAGNSATGDEAAGAGARDSVMDNSNRDNTTISNNKTAIHDNKDDKNKNNNNKTQKTSNNMPTIKATDLEHREGSVRALAYITTHAAAIVPMPILQHAVGVLCTLADVAQPPMLAAAAARGLGVVCVRGGPVFPPGTCCMGVGWRGKTEGYIVHMFCMVITCMVSTCFEW